MTSPKPITLAEARKELTNPFVLLYRIGSGFVGRSYYVTLKEAKRRKCPGDLICRVRLERVK